MQQARIWQLASGRAASTPCGRTVIQSTPLRLDSQQSVLACLRMCVPSALTSLLPSLQVTYETYALERYILRKVKGETHITVEEWHGGDVGF